MNEVCKSDARKSFHGKKKKKLSIISHQIMMAADVKGGSGVGT